MLARILYRFCLIFRYFLGFGSAIVLFYSTAITQFRNIFHIEILGGKIYKKKLQIRFIFLYHLNFVYSQDPIVITGFYTHTKY